MNYIYLFIFLILFKLFYLSIYLSIYLFIHVFIYLWCLFRHACPSNTFYVSAESDYTALSTILPTPSNSHALYSGMTQTNIYSTASSSSPSTTDAHVSSTAVYVTMFSDAGIYDTFYPRYFVKSEKEQ